MENLPEEILSIIFVELPAKQLAQMRCISRPWNALLSQSSFKNFHLDRSLHNNDGILLVFPDSFSFKSKLITAHPTQSPQMKIPNFIKLPVNPQSKNTRGRIIGSVNGLICFRCRSHQDSVFLYIWNPSLSAVVTLPPYSMSPHFDYWFAGENFRFGFDPKTDDYKVVNVKLLGKMHMQVEVYSMRKGSWELITQTIPSHVSCLYDHDLVCVDGHDGHLHWLGENEWGRNYFQTILAFDLGAETFREIPLPDSIRNKKAMWKYLGVLGGKLCVMSTVNDGDQCEVWVMDEYGVAESWVKHHVSHLIVDGTLS